ncbi:MAG: ATP-binding cassette domain-containing protein [Clostridium sp.]
MRIDVINYTKHIKNDCVLKNINLSLESGKIYGLCGGNGSGKTMLLRALSGLIRSDKGEIKINNVVLSEGKFPEDIGLMIGHTTLLNEYTGIKNLEIINDIDKRCTKGELEELMTRLLLNPKDKKTVKKYSMGMNQKLVIAQAVMGSPKIILLDEPTNSLDDSAIKAVRDILKEEKDNGGLIVIASHNKEDIGLLCDEIFTIKLGEVINHEKK